jgi:hypothetical protein
LQKYGKRADLFSNPVHSRSIYTCPVCCGNRLACGIFPTEIKNLAAVWFYEFSSFTTAFATCKKRFKPPV